MEGVRVVDRGSLREPRFDTGSPARNDSLKNPDRRFDARLFSTAAEMHKKRSAFKSNSDLTKELAATQGKKRRSRKRGLKADHAPRRNDLQPEPRLERRFIDQLTAIGNTVRKSEETHLQTVEHSIATFGGVVPPIVSEDGEVIDGHIRLQAAQRLGLTEIWCIVVDHLPNDELRKLRLSLNRIQEQGEWDLEGLKAELETFIDQEVILDIPGFETEELEVIINSGEVVFDEAANALPAEIPDQPVVSRIGDLFTLGDHILMCADAGDPKSYKHLPKDLFARIVFTDPPYNVRINGFVGGKGKVKHADFQQGSGELTRDQFKAFLQNYLTCASDHVMDGGLIYNFIDGRHVDLSIQAGCEAGLDYINLIVWVKSNGGMGSLYRSAHELVCLFKKGKVPYLNNVQLGKFGRDRTNVWQYPGVTSRGSTAQQAHASHPTPKPVELVEDAILDVTDRGDIVLDPFLGSGTTLIAAEKTRRVCYGLELDPKYVDVSIRRWQGFTGHDAIHKETGLTFEQLRIERSGGESQADPPQDRPDRPDDDTQGELFSDADSDRSPATQESF